MEVWKMCSGSYEEAVQLQQSERGESTVQDPPGRPLRTGCFTSESNRKVMKSCIQRNSMSGLMFCGDHSACFIENKVQMGKV